MQKKEVGRFNDNIIQEFEAICGDYSTHSSEQNLNALLDIFQKLKPDWVEKFNELDERLLDEKNIEDKTFDDFLTIKLPKTYTVDRLKAPKNEKNSVLVDIMQRGRIIHLVNKIAHHFEDVFDNRIMGYIVKNDIPCETREEFDEVKRKIRQIYNPNTKDRIKEIAKSNLILLYGFEGRDFERGKNLDVLNFPELVRAYNDGMYIKALEIENVNRLAHDYDREDISYGVKKFDEDNILFVMDVKGYGQFSVHMKDPDLIAQIKTKYTMPIYRRKTAMLVNYVSKQAKEFIEESKKDDSMDEERNIPKHANEIRKRRARLLEELKFLDLTKAEKHELGVKGGLTRKELQELDDAKEERW